MAIIIIPAPAPMTIWHADHKSGLSGDIDPQEVFVRFLREDGAAIIEQGDKPWHHRVIGCGVGHDDARFAESGGHDGSMAAYYENGEAFNGRWWESDIIDRYYKI